MKSHHLSSLVISLSCQNLQSGKFACFACTILLVSSHCPVIERNRKLMLGQKLGKMQGNAKKCCLQSCRKVFTSFCNYVQVTFLGEIDFKLDSSESQSIKLGWHHFCHIWYWIDINLHHFARNYDQLHVEQKMVLVISYSID